MHIVVDALLEALEGSTNHLTNIPCKRRSRPIGHWQQQHNIFIELSVSNVVLMKA